MAVAPRWAAAEVATGQPPGGWGGPTEHSLASTGLRAHPWPLQTDSSSPARRISLLVSGLSRRECVGAAACRQTQLGAASRLDLRVEGGGAPLVISSPPGGANGA